MEKEHRCEKRVYGGSFTGHQCSNKGKYFVNGRWFCGIHNPNKKPSKRQRRSDAERKLQRARWRFDDAARKFVEQLASEGDERAVSIMSEFEKALNEYNQTIRMIEEDE